MTSDNTPSGTDNGVNSSLTETDQMVDALSDALSEDSIEMKESVSSEVADNTSVTSTDSIENSTNTEQNTSVPPKKLKADKKVKAPRRNGAVSWLALLIALGAAGGSAYTYWQQQQLAQTSNDNVAQVQATAADLKRDMQTDLQSRLNSFSGDSDKLMNELSQSNSRLERKLKVDFAELNERVSTLR